MFKKCAPIALLTMVLVLGLAACGEKTETSEQPAQTSGTDVQAAGAPAKPVDPNAWNGDVVETMNSGGYTYVLVDTGVEQIWAAAPQTQVQVGQAVSVPKGMMMANFESKTLGRTFDEIYFVSGIFPEGRMPGSDGSPAGDPQSGMPGMGGDTSKGEFDAQSHSKVADAEVEPVSAPAGGYKIADVYATAAELGGKTVQVRGRVVKFTPNIMGTNWVHLQDGSGKGETADLTVTTEAMVSVGDVILVEGPLSVNKDFGAGYKYKAIIENAKVTVE